VSGAEKAGLAAAMLCGAALGFGVLLVAWWAV